MGLWSGHNNRNRGGAALASLGVHLVLIAALLWGLRSSERARDESDPALASVTTFETQPPPPEAEPEPTQSAKDEPAPEAPRAEAAPVEAPVVAIPLAPPVAAADVAAEAQANRSGSGVSGAGSGGGGTGDGGGGVATPARRIAGVLRDSDYPRAAEREGMAGTVAILFRIRADGRVDRCSVLASSGHALLDELTCRLFTERFRFEPARAANGRAVESTQRTTFTWGTRRR